MVQNTISPPHVGPSIFVAPVLRVLWTYFLGVRGMSCWNENFPPLPFVLKVLGLIFLASIGWMWFVIVWGVGTIGVLGIFFLHHRVLQWSDFSRMYGSLCCIYTVYVWGDQLQCDWLLSVKVFECLWNFDFRPMFFWFQSIVGSLSWMLVDA